MRTVNVLSLQRSTAADQAKIVAIDPGVRLTDAGGWFDGEIRDTWSDYAIKRYLTPGSTGSGTREERDRLLAEAEVVIGGWPSAGGALPEGFSEIGAADDLDRLLPQADFVAVCCQWTPETTGLFNRDRFALMKPGSVIVNVARGEIIDEDALYEALQR